MNEYVPYHSPIGELTLVFSGDYLTKLLFGSLATCEEFAGRSPAQKLTEKWLDEYFGGANPDFLPPIKAEGTPFMREVWEILLTIPYGQTMTYGEIAAVLAARRPTGKMSARAVGHAVGSNPIPIIIPCHRVVAANGLGGYSSGTDIKIALLNIEGNDKLWKLNF